MKKNGFTSLYEIYMRYCQELLSFFWKKKKTYIGLIQKICHHLAEFFLLEKPAVMLNGVHFEKAKLTNLISKLDLYI